MLNRLFTATGLLLALAVGCSKQRDLAPPVVTVTITSISPVTGPDTGSTTITINGGGFVAGTTVTVGGAAATNVTIVSSTQLTADTPAGTAGPVDVVVTVPGASATSVNGFTYLNGPAPNPTVTRIDPTWGPTAGGTTVTLTGSGYQTGVTVTVGGVAATNVTLLTGGLLTFDTPAGSAGGANVVVTNLDTTTVTVAGGFTYGVPAPTVTAINVNTGPVAGGTAVTITGTGFESSGSLHPTVLIGGAPATSVFTVNATTLTATTGAAAVVGPQNVQVTNPNVNSGTGAGLYTYVGANPAPTALNPSVGPEAGGTTTTITGSNFYPGATVTVAGTAATVGTITPTSIVITTAVVANPNGGATVVVTNLDGNSGNLANGFTFQGAAPTITGGTVNPTNGPAGGTNTVTITGTNFRAGVTVTIGGNAATITGGTLPTSIEVTAPAGTAGPTTVVVTNTDLTSVSAPYTYNPPPVLSSLNPSNGPEPGGGTCTLTGIGFLNGCTVNWNGSNLVTTFVNSTTLTVTIPSGTGGDTVFVTNPDLQTSGNQTYTYDPPPTLGGLNPTGGPLAGGNTVTLSGTNFVSGASVSWNGSFIATTFVSGTTLTVSAPSGSVGGVTVFVRNPDLQTSGNQTYTYAAAPAINTGPPIGLSPSNGPAAGGGTCTVSGTAYVNGCTVNWNGVNLTTTWVNATTLTVTIPPGTAPSSVNVFVTNPDLQTSNTVQYTYNPAPTITTGPPVGLSPSNGAAAGGGTCTVTGTGFITGCTVNWNGGNITTAFVSSTQVTVTIPAGTAPSSVNVFVTNPDLQTSNTVQYTYNLPPVLSTLTPSAGPETGGNTVTLNGTDFVTGASVSWNGSFIATAFVSGTTLTVTAPPLPPGGVTVFVQNPDGQTSGNLTYTYDPAQTHVLTGPTDFQVQERDGIDISAVPGSFQLALTTAGFASNGTRVTCIAYDKNSNQRLIVGTDSAGAFLSTNGGSSWTAFNLHSSPALPANHVLCAEFFSPSSGPNTGGNVFIIGTTQGAVLTHDSGAAFRTYTTGSTPRVPGARVQGADFYDGYTVPTHFLLASNSGTNLGGGAALWTTDGGNHFLEINATSKPLALFGNYITGVAYSPNSDQKFLIGAYSPDSPQSNFGNEGGTGGVYLTTDGFGSFTRFSTVSTPSTPSQGCTAVAFDPSDTVNGQRWAASFDGHAPANSGSWSGGLFVTGDDGSTATVYTTSSTPSIASNDVRHVRYGGVAGEFVVATEAGLEVTTTNGTSFSRHTTGSVVRIPNDFVNGCDMISGASALTGTVGVATGQRTTTTIGGGAAQSTDNLTSSVSVLTLVPPATSLPHPDVRDVAVYTGNSAGTHLLAATGRGCAFSTDGGANWTIWNTTSTPALPSNDVRSVAWWQQGSTPARCIIGTAAGIVVVSNVLGSPPTFTTLNTGSGLISNDVTSVDYFSGSGSVTDTVIAGTSAGISIVTSATTTPGFTSRTSGSTPPIASNTVRAVAFWHGQTSSGRVAVATAGGLSVSTDGFATVLNSTTSVAGLPSSNCNDVDIWDGGGGGNAILVGHAAGASVTTAGGGAGNWTNFTQASTFGAMPTNVVEAVAFFDAGTSAGTFALGCSSTAQPAWPNNITAGAILITTNGLAPTPAWSRRTTGTAPAIPSDMPSAFDFDESLAGGGRWICSCTATDPNDTTGTAAPGGLVTENGTRYRSLGTLTVPQLEGGVMPRTSPTNPTWDSRFIRGASFRPGSTQHLVAGSLYGAAGSVDGGATFAVASEASTPAFLSGVVLDTAIYGGDGTGRTWIAATPAGPYFTSNGGTSFLLRSGLPTNDVRGIEFHHGVAGLLAAATSQGLAVSTDNGATWTVFNAGNGLQNDCRDVDFWDAGTTSGSIRVAVATSNGVYVTTNLTTGATPTATWTQRSNVGAGKAGNNVWAVRYDENDAAGNTFWVGTWFAAFNQVGGAASTTDHGATFGNVPATLQFYFAWDIDVQPGTSGHVLLAHQGGCAVTTNGGTSWTNHTFESTSGQLPNSDVRRVSYSSNTATWLAGTDDGLVVTTNGGTSFGPYLRGTLSQYAYLAVSETTTGGTIRYQILDANGVLIPDADLSGNAAGLTPTAGQIDLSGLSVATYPSIQVRVILTSTDGSATPSVQDLTLVYQY